MHPRLDAQEHIARLRQRHLRRLRHHDAALPRWQLSEKRLRQLREKRMPVAIVPDERLDDLRITRSLGLAPGHRHLGNLHLGLRQSRALASLQSELRQRLVNLLPLIDRRDVVAIERHWDVHGRHIGRAHADEPFHVVGELRFRVDPFGIDRARRPDHDHGFRGLDLVADHLPEHVHGQELRVEPDAVAGLGEVQRKVFRRLRRALTVADKNVGQSTPRVQRRPEPQMTRSLQFLAQLKQVLNFVGRCTARRHRRARL